METISNYVLPVILVLLFITALWAWLREAALEMIGLDEVDGEAVDEPEADEETLND